MALRARLVAPRTAPEKVWQWHTVKATSIPASVLFSGDRRMEAETYLSSGYGIRVAIESKPQGWVRFGKVANVEQPNRLKGILVSPEYGEPFLAATQVFDVRPIPRKFLAIEKMDGARSCYVEDGTILVTRSGSVGRPTVAHNVHEGIVISDDLLRVKAIDPLESGWIYAYLHAVQTRAMTKGAQYGHMIKHLEVSHLEALPIPLVDQTTAKAFTQRLARIVSLRNDSYRLTLEAEKQFEDAFTPVRVDDWGESGFTVKASAAFVSKRKRLDASVHNPGAAAIKRHLAKTACAFDSLQKAGFDIWVPGRYKRIPAEDGVIYRDSADLLEVSPDLTKRFADCKFGDQFGGRVKSGWILIPCSGQVYGIIGTATLATDALHDQVVSNHVVRVAPKPGGAPAGYVLTALSHPTLGRPLVKALAFGSSVPELDPDDLADLALPRLSSKVENAIAELAEASAKARADADLLERDLAAEATTLVDSFISGTLLTKA